MADCYETSHASARGRPAIPPGPLRLRPRPGPGRPSPPPPGATRQARCARWPAPPRGPAARARPGIRPRPARQPADPGWSCGARSIPLSASPAIRPISQATPVMPPPPRTSERVSMTFFYTNPPSTPIRASAGWRRDRQSKAFPHRVPVLGAILSAGPGSSVRMRPRTHRLRAKRTKTLSLHPL